MVDSSGPSLPRKCNTVALQDLGDTEGWGQEGSGLYLFELRDTVYHRVSLPAIPPRTIEWVMDFKLTNPFVWTKRSGRVTKWQNSGTALASLLPLKPGVKLRYPYGKGYGVVSVKKTGGMILVPELRKVSDTIEPGSTIAFVLFLGKPPPSVDVKPVRGVKLDWDDSAVSQKVGIIIQVPKQGPNTVHTTRADVRVSIEDKVYIDHFNLYNPGYYLRRVLMVDDLPDMTRVEPYLT